ncbi:MAG: hypothetical protein KDC98_18845 [Planctomycetes bacterium]|nr:hypothetical protein [Planctomycetota bacterium]
MARHRRVDGGEHLRGQLDRDLTLAAGTEVLLRKDGNDYVLMLVRPAEPWRPSKKQRSHLAAANCPRGALRRDPRHNSEQATP